VSVFGGLLRTWPRTVNGSGGFRLRPQPYRLIRYPTERERSLYGIACLVVVALAELMRFTLTQLFQGKYLFTLYQPDKTWANVAVFFTTLFTVSIPLKTWASARNERLLESKERLLVQARLAALSSQINPHFLFNALNTVSSLIRPTRKARMVVSNSRILRRLLRRPTTSSLARRVGFRRTTFHRNGPFRRKAALREADRRATLTARCRRCCCSR
jgi:hypothetical protein